MIAPVPAWIVNGLSYTLSDLFTGQLVGHNSSGINIIVEDIMMNDDRNGSVYICIIPQAPPTPDIESDPTTLYVAGEYNGSKKPMILTLAITCVCTDVSYKKPRLSYTNMNTA